MRPDRFFRFWQNKQKIKKKIWVFPNRNRIARKLRFEKELFHKENVQIRLITKETSYLFADIVNFDYKQINPDNKPIFVANLNENIGLPRIRQHAVNIKNQLDVLESELKTHKDNDLISNRKEIS